MVVLIEHVDVNVDVGRCRTLLRSVVLRFDLQSIKFLLFVIERRVEMNFSGLRRKKEKVFRRRIDGNDRVVYPSVRTDVSVRGVNASDQRTNRRRFAQVELQISVSEDRRSIVHVDDVQLHGHSTRSRIRFAAVRRLDRVLKSRTNFSIEQFHQTQR